MLGDPEEAKESKQKTKNANTLIAELHQAEDSREITKLTPYDEEKKKDHLCKTRAEIEADHTEETKMEKSFGKTCKGLNIGKSIISKQSKRGQYAAYGPILRGEIAKFASNHSNQVKKLNLYF